MPPPFPRQMPSVYVCGCAWINSAVSGFTKRCTFLYLKAAIIHLPWPPPCDFPAASERFVDRAGVLPGSHSVCRPHLRSAELLSLPSAAVLGWIMHANKSWVKTFSEQRCAQQRFAANWNTAMCVMLVMWLIITAGVGDAGSVNCPPASPIKRLLHVLLHSCLVLLQLTGNSASPLKY